MKINKIILPVVASAMLLTGCDDQIMEWGLQEGHTAVTSADLPLAVKEVLSNYDDIKKYSSDNHPNMKLGLGIGKDIYMGEDDRHDLAANNFQMVTWGNAMKMDAIVSASGALNFASLDPALEQLQEDGIDLYGHNFFWHTQQQQTYLKSLIAPKFVPADTGSDIENMLTGDSWDFEGGTKGGWGSWGNSSTSDIANEGYNSDYSLHLTNPTDGGSGNDWKAQAAYTFDAPLKEGTEYTIRFYAKSASAAGTLQFCHQNSSTYSHQIYYSFPVGTDWTLCEYTFTMGFDDVDRILINFGAVATEYWVDNIEFGIKKEDPMENVIFGDSNDFEGGTKGNWGSWGNSSTSDISEKGDGYKSDYSLVLTNPTDGGSGNDWKAQAAYTFDAPLIQGKKYIIQFYAKSASSAGTLQFCHQNSQNYNHQIYYSFPVGTDWTLCEYEFEQQFDDVDRILINFGAVATTYWVDNIKFGLAKDQGEAGARQFYANRAGAAAHYEIKTAEEKNQILTDAMEAWVKGMAEHLAEKEIVPVGYDVINEAIADGSNGVRGLNGVFGGSITDDDGNTTYDAEPVETEEEGLNLNWGSGHWYWGYYVPDYAVKAFQFARKYLPASTKLFYNDYNLESSDSKRAAAIKFVQDIDAANGSAIVDGIGTQMHVSFSPTDDADENTLKLAELKEKVDKQFKELAATGKLIRVTELDISVNTGSPSAAQYKAQSDAYQLIFESYFENVPEAQQSGITIWSLTDAEDEHEYWLKGQKPNLWDESFKRKWAYKGVCDALAGEDVGLTFGSDSYKTYYEKQNVSDTVK
ncbi:MAG: endo-1,4-beta-xylanase [Prevotella sp.]|nr:endo-1,4-beta-xylanase [Prevotella sp.]